MTTKEKRLLYIALAIFAGYVLPFEIIPRSAAFYQQRQENIAKFKTDIQRYRRLEEQAAVWQTKHQEALQQQDEIQKGLLQGKNRELAAARLQSILKEIAQQSGMQVQSLALPEFAITGQWLSVTQGMQFNAAPKNTLDFLNALRDHQILLMVVSLEIRTAGIQLQGTIKVTGFNAIVTESPPPVEKG